LRKVVDTTIDFEGLEKGEVVSEIETECGPVGVSGANPRLGGDNAAVIYDSSCAGGCSGGDTDLSTPSQGNVLIIAENLVDQDGDDRVDTPTIRRTRRWRRTSTSRRSACDRSRDHGHRRRRQ
jgi:hypothetical protein